jgi:predicted nucleic acid-binding protein
VITAVDTSILLDLFTDDERHGPAAARALRASLDQGRLVACEAVWAEVCALFSEGKGPEVLGRLGVEYDPLGIQAATRAGTLWAAYRAAGGPRTRVVADFLIGAHAYVQADHLLTRDRGFYRAYFRDLAVLEP